MQRITIIREERVTIELDDGETIPAVVRACRDVAPGSTGRLIGRLAKRLPGADRRLLVAGGE